MTDWSVFFTGPQLRNAIGALGQPSLPTATGNVYALVWDSSVQQAQWLFIATSTAT